jgi:hypothetical protein
MLAGNFKFLAKGAGNMSDPILRMRPTLLQRVQRRAPPVIDLWLSADDRRLGTLLRPGSVDR